MLKVQKEKEKERGLPLAILRNRQNEIVCFNQKDAPGAEQEEEEEILRHPRPGRTQTARKKKKRWQCKYQVFSLDMFVWGLVNSTRRGSDPPLADFFSDSNSTH